MVGFEYPTQPHIRRHGPAGYEGYESYRDWLRDEFMFRCVYCLRREQWCERDAAFHIDHFLPVKHHPDGKCEYSNLLYACAACNEAKKAVLDVPNPCMVAFHDCLRIIGDGSVKALNDNGKKLAKALGLNKPSRVAFRSRWMRMLTTLEGSNSDLYREFMGFPGDLPDLRKKQVPTNTKPEGSENCYFALRERGKLPQMY
jgi:hypothetical protein